MSGTQRVQQVWTAVSECKCRRHRCRSLELHRQRSGGPGCLQLVLWNERHLLAHVRHVWLSVQHHTPQRDHVRANGWLLLFECSLTRIIGCVRSRSYVDHSILEVYANDRFALTTRVYPEYEVAHSVVLTTYGGDPGFVFSFTATPMTAVMNLPPTTPSGPTGLAWWAWALIVVGAVVVVLVAAAVGRHVYIARRGTGRHYVGMGDNSTPDDDVDRHPGKPASPTADGL